MDLFTEESSSALAKIPRSVCEKMDLQLMYHKGQPKGFCRRPSRPPLGKSWGSAEKCGGLTKTTFSVLVLAVTKGERKIGKGKKI